MRNLIDLILLAQCLGLSIVNNPPAMHAFTKVHRARGHHKDDLITYNRDNWAIKSHSWSDYFITGEKLCIIEEVRSQKSEDGRSYW